MHSGSPVPREEPEYDDVRELGQQVINFQASTRHAFATTRETLRQLGDDQDQDRLDFANALEGKADAGEVAAIQQQLEDIRQAVRSIANDTRDALVRIEDQQVADKADLAKAVAAKASKEDLEATIEVVEEECAGIHRALDDLPLPAESTPSDDMLGHSTQIQRRRCALIVGSATLAAAMWVLAIKYKAGNIAFMPIILFSLVPVIVLAGPLALKLKYKNKTEREIDFSNWGKKKSKKND